MELILLNSDYLVTLFYLNDFIEAIVEEKLQNVTEQAMKKTS